MENWDSILWVLVKFAILSLVVERALYVVFEWTLFEKLEDILDTRIGVWFDVKPPIAIAISLTLAFLAGLDLVSVLFSTPETAAGMIVTGLYIAGGSKAVFVMFDRIRDLREAKVAAQISEALN